jgi:hypothetical protein
LKGGKGYGTAMTKERGMKGKKIWLGSKQSAMKEQKHVMAGIKRERKVEKDMRRQ